jgi:peptidoglycan hydrolase CwlO-like protein
MEIYDRVAKVVAPKKAALAVAEGEYAEAMKGLNAKQAELQVVLDKLEAMQNQLKALAAKKESLENEYEVRGHRAMLCGAVARLICAARLVCTARLCGGCA